MERFSRTFLADGPSSPQALRFVLMAAATSALTALTLGYDVGCVGDAAPDIQEYFGMTSGEKELVVGSLNFVSAFGALIAGPTADLFGRRPSVALCVCLYIVGTLLMAFATSWTVLLLGRVITGLGVGVSFVTVPVYVAELAPAGLRGRLTTLFDISINVGILAGYVVGYAVEKAVDGYGGPSALKWRLDLGLGAVPPAAVLYLLRFLPESPRFLLMRNRREEAVAVLERTLGSRKAAALEADAILGVQSDETTPLSGAAAAPEGAAPWSEVLFPAERATRRAMFLVLGLAFVQQATGSEAVLYYSGDFLYRAGLTSRDRRFLGNIAVGCCKLLPEVLALLYVDSLGRSLPLVASSVLCTLFILLLGASYDGNWAGLTVVGLLCAFMASFSIAIGPFTWIVVAEVLPQRCRAKGTTLGIFVNRITSGIVALTALSTAQAFGFDGFFYFYAAVSAAGLYFYAACVPETAGRTLTEIEHMLARPQAPAKCPCARRRPGGAAGGRAQLL